MKVYTEQNWAFIDVDGTLIKECHGLFTDTEIAQFVADKENTFKSYLRDDGYVSALMIKNPYTGDIDQLETLTQHIRLVKHLHGRGRKILIWSGNGPKYAALVAEALGLKPYVKLVMAKPILCVDDLEPNVFLPRIFLEKGKR